MGDDSTVITGNVTDKRESKKAAAKTAGWIIGGALSALFTGVGAYKVYSGTVQKEFIINKNSLYVLNNGVVTANNLLKITPAEFDADSITVKKNIVTMTSVDKNQVIKFFTNRKSALSAEQIAEYLNNIFVNNVAPTVEESAQTDGEASSDPFTELLPDGAATETDGTQADEKELSVEQHTTDESADNE